jgi:hypothetical protein
VFARHAVEGKPSPFDRDSRGDRKTAAQYTNFMGTRAVKGRADLELEKTLAIPALVLETKDFYRRQQREQRFCSTRSQNFRSLRSLLLENPFSLSSLSFVKTHGCFSSQSF